MKDWREVMHERATRRDVPMKPQVIAHELGKRLRDDAIVSCDSGTIATWWARHIPVKKGQIHSLSGNLASMANGLPYTLAAQIAYPERQCVAFVGDGGFSMLMADDQQDKQSPNYHKWITPELFGQKFGPSDG